MIKKSYFLPALFALIFVTPVLAIDPPVSTQSALRQEIKKDLRQEFQTKLAALKDERKKTLVTKLDARLNEINKNHTGIMSATLSRLEETLAKLQARLETANSTGKDTTAVQASLTKATSIIASARSAIISQAAKSYTMNITTETGLKSAYGITRSALAKDLTTTHRTVISAKKAVLAVITTLAQVTGETIIKEIAK